MDLNRATIIGRLTRDPEVRATPTGKSVANIAVATGRVWTDANGTKQEKTEFHNVVLWGKMAEIAGQYLGKGRKVYIEGRIETRDWVGQDSVKRYRTEIIAENLIMLDGSRGTAGAAPATTSAEPAYNAPANADDDIRVEDIPF